MDNIPLQQIVSHPNTIGRTGSSDTVHDDYPNDNMTPAQHEKSGLFHRHTRGRRKMKKITSKGVGTGRKGSDGEEDTVNLMGQIYDKFMNFSIVTRYFVYVAPVGAAIAVPIVVGATAAKNATIGGEKAKDGTQYEGVRIVWFFTWIEIGKAIRRVGGELSLCRKG